MILSTQVLGEAFVWQYDLTAMMFIVGGTVSIIFQANTEQRVFTGDEIKDLLFSFRTLVYVSVCIFFFVVDRICLRIMLEKLRLFEADANAYDEERQVDKKSNNSGGMPFQAISGLQAVPETESQVSAAPILPKIDSAVELSVKEFSVNNKTALLDSKDSEAIGRRQTTNDDTKPK